MVDSDFTIISGLALGTDIHAHKSTLECYGKTIAVLPCSIENIIPKSHAGYANKILKQDGLLVSEYYYNEKIQNKKKYIYRNRIISGLSDAVIIAECAEKSGTMHTARYAYKQNKPLFCFNNNSSGVIKILKSGYAKVYNNLDDFYF